MSILCVEEKEKIIGSCNAQLSNRVGEGDDFKQWHPSSTTTYTYTRKVNVAVHLHTTAYEGGR